MPRFVRILQLLVAILMAAFLVYGLVFNGISLFYNHFMWLSLGLWLFLELALQVIYKLIEDD